MNKNRLMPGILLMLFLIIGIWASRNAEKRSSDINLNRVAPEISSSDQQANINNLDQVNKLSQQPVTGSIIDLADIPENLYDPDNRYLRWLRGEYQPGEGSSVIGHDLRRSLQVEAQTLESNENIQTAEEMTGQTEITNGTTFDSMDFVNCCGAGGFVPPDPELAVGPGHILAVVNVAFEIYNKTGSVLVPATTFATLFSGVSGCTVGTDLFDPNVLYDEEADRFILGIDAGGSGYCLAVSLSNDPTGQWARYRFPTNGAGGEFDYPHAGVGRDAIYMGGNIFSGNSFIGSRIWAFDKWAMYDVAAAPWQERSIPNGEHTPQPANLHGYLQDAWPSSGPHYFITGTNSGAIYSVQAWHDPFGTNTLVDNGSFNLDQATGVTSGTPVDVPQPTGDKIMANDTRPQDAEYRNGYLWTANTISCNPGTGSVDCVRWAQIDPSSAAIAQAGVLATNGDYRFFADLAVNHCDDMAIGYTRTDPSDLTWGYPSIFVAGRKNSEPLGQLGAESPMKLSNTEYKAFDWYNPAHRWGDYTGFTSDPDGWHIWYMGQYSKDTGDDNGRWGTFIGQISLSQPTSSGAFPSAPLDHFIYLPFVSFVTSNPDC